MELNNVCVCAPQCKRIGHNEPPITVVTDIYDRTLQNRSPATCDHSNRQTKEQGVSYKRLPRFARIHTYIISLIVRQECAMTPTLGIGGEWIVVDRWCMFSD